MQYKLVWEFLLMMNLTIASFLWLFNFLKVLKLLLGQPYMEFACHT